MSGQLQVVWFKRDLRTHDHEPLHRAAGGGPVLPLYIVEPELWRQTDLSARQWAFCRESLQSLREDLARLGQPLVVRTGDAVEILQRLLRERRVTALWSHQETGNAWTYARDRRVAALLSDRGVPWHQCRQHGIQRGRADRDRWSPQWEALMAGPVLAPLPLAGLRIAQGEIPEQPGTQLASDPCPGRQPGGRIAGEQALHSFLAVRGSAYQRAMSSPLSAQTGCSRISTHLAFGTLSLRETVQLTRRRLAETPQRSAWRPALAAFEGRLHWHCHFMQKLESEPDIEFRNLHRAMDGLRGATADPVRLSAWCDGQTGWPMVDACMRFLHHGGWLNFRMRAMLMAVASYQLWLPWRQTGLHLARQFVDYEPGIHWPQVQMQSGTTGINALRIYNPVKQSRELDPDGRFLRTWLPELAGVDGDWVHEPWRMPADLQRRYGVVIGNDYPAPLVDHERAARLARQRVAEARRSAAARNESQGIQHAHGSRRRARHPDSRRYGRQSGPGPQPDLFDDGP
jgi:deoxyribodipyrimidine photo-lyase